MKILGSPRVASIKNSLLPVGDFILAAKKLHCTHFTPVQRLSSALEDYDVLEVFADGRGRNALNSRKTISAFLSGQKEGLSLADNLQKSLKGKRIMAFIHEDGLLGVIDNKDAHLCLREIDPYRKLSPAEDLAQVIEEETQRDSQRPGHPSLDDYEGNILSSSNNLMLAQTISGEDYSEDHEDLVMLDRSDDPE